MESVINASIFGQDNTNKIQALDFNENLRVMEKRISWRMKLIIIDQRVDFT